YSSSLASDSLAVWAPGQQPRQPRETKREFAYNPQNVNLTAAWTNRGAPAFTTCPNESLSISPLTAAGPKNWVWLKVLKVSRRVCSAFDSDSRNDRRSARSKLSIPGP